MCDGLGGLGGPEEGSQERTAQVGGPVAHGRDTPAFQLWATWPLCCFFFVKMAQPNKATLFTVSFVFG